MNCPNIEQFAELADGLLADEALSEFETHIEGCPDCRIMAAELGRLASPGEMTLPWLSVGDRVGRYVIRGWLGGGAMGQVFAAEDPQLGRQVAIKLPRAEEGPGRERLLLEAMAMAQLAHPNVVTVHDAGVADDRAFIAMELVVGESLSDWLLGTRSWPEVLEAFIAAGKGLAAAHEAGLLHRDFKPANTLVAGDGRVLVTDFGLATGTGIENLEDELGCEPMGSPAEAQLTATGALIGTPAYMAPEQLEGLAATEQSDQFSFAVALYEALNGSRPFEDAQPARAVELIAAGPAPSTSRAPAAVTKAIETALAAEPSRRHRSMDAFLAALARGARARRRRATIAVATIAASALALGKKQIRHP